ncbi:MAG: hypothetical protein OXP71_18285 [Candidatus Poribacteria bacterium]|nr:hypothetical protein [Candidatus Poribacteria bacterium]
MAKITCPRCGSEDIMHNLRIRDHSDAVGSAKDLEVEVQGNPDALIFKKARTAKLRATVCGGCGNVGLSVDKPKTLWATYSRQSNAQLALHKRSS